MFASVNHVASLRLGFSPLFSVSETSVAGTFGLSVGLPAIVGEAVLFAGLGIALGVVGFRRRMRVLRTVHAQELLLLRQETERSQRDAQGAEAQVVVVRLAGDSLPFGLLVIDENGTEVLCNPEVAVVLGPKSPSVPDDTRIDSRSDGEVMAGGTLRRLLDRAAEGQRGREMFDVVGPPRRSFTVAAEPIGERINGRFAVVGTVQDASEARRTEAMRQDFITNVSHELRTPVGAIAILAETLAAETDKQAAARLTGRLEHEAHRLSVMVDDLLALGTVESSGSGPDDYVPVPELIDEAIERARVSAETRKLAIEVSSVGHGLLVRGDRRQLVTALHNLLENALKYSDKGQPVIVDASLPLLPPAPLISLPNGEMSASTPRVAIAVRDSGIGIPTRDQERIFERFYRVDRARARDTGGSGLGLAIVRHVVRNHDGDITVASQEGEGSTFTLHLPGYARVSSDSAQAVDVSSARSNQQGNPNGI